MSAESATPEVIYHYCSLDTFRAIVTSRSLRMSNIFFMNDSQEHLWIRRLALEQIEAKLASIDSGKAPPTWLLKLKSIMEVDTPQHVYCASFSKLSDDLSQWRAYADDGKGVAIGFDRSYFRALEDADFELMVEDVLYNPAQAQEHISKLIENCENLLDVGSASAGKFAELLKQSGGEYMPKMEAAAKAALSDMGVPDEEITSETLGEVWELLMTYIFVGAMVKMSAKGEIPQLALMFEKITDGKLKLDELMNSNLGGKQGLQGMREAIAQLRTGLDAIFAALNVFIMWQCAPLYKRPEFQSEHEVRVVYTPKSNTSDEEELPSSPLSECSFAVKNMLTPYYLIPLIVAGEVPPIAHVVFGPKCEAKANKWSAIMMLKAHGLFHPGMRFSASNVSYRG